MKHSRLDLILVVSSIFQWVGLLLWCGHFEQLSYISHAGLFFLFLILFYFNPIVVTHNFLHTPFFKMAPINRAYSIFNSMNLGLPQILYKYHHLNHHRHNNSMEDPSSTYLFGKAGIQEHWISYSAFSLFRDGTKQAWIQSIQKKEGHILAAEIIAVILYWSALIIMSWKFFLIIYLPMFYFGWFLAHIENYFEHYKATAPSNRFGNAVSFYPRWYNLIMFNEGYHQEHHISPQEHWTKRPSTQTRYETQMKESGAFKASKPPLLGMFE
ncbi:MAG TPA: fatty acid desaturase [Bacteriovoracaceae bacterium]|nr:fatty acid desaturase [Bacteriovoracaceae bacterium]